MNTQMTTPFVLTLSCPDQTGIVYQVTGVLAKFSGNITDAAQHNDKATKQFFMRVAFDLNSSHLGDVASAFEALSQSIGMRFSVRPAGEKIRAVLMVSKLGHCLNDLLFRVRSGALPLDVRAVVSNHADFYQLAASYNIPFHHIPVTAQTKQKAEERMLELVEQEQVELVVLARYMQVLSQEVCQRLSGRIINIHHSFLPSFKGARPYYQAFDRGVKIIGATAHYVTADLDEGPIIEQDVARVDHSCDAEQLTRIGSDVECSVLARAVSWHAQHRILIDGHKTVVFR